MQWAVNGISCRRASLLRLLGSQGPCVLECDNCDVRHTSGASFSTISVLADLSEAAASLISEVQGFAPRASYVSVLREGGWRRLCLSLGHADTLILHLFAAEVLRFSYCAVDAGHSNSIVATSTGPMFTVCGSRCGPRSADFEIPRTGACALSNSCWPRGVKSAGEPITDNRTAK